MFPRIPAAALSLLLGAWIASPAHALTSNHRLGHEAMPRLEIVYLRLDPDSARYDGSVRIQLAVAAPCDSFQLHAEDLDLRRVSLRGAKGPVAVAYDVNEHDLLTLRPKTTLAAGAYTLDIEFSNDFNTRANSLYRLTVDGRGYCFTQFESKAAREAFPCFDEPEFKIPWRIELSIPKAQVAISNMPVARDSVVGARRNLTFQQTPPLPSYLVAIAAGPLESVPIPGMSVPGHIITVKGHAGLAGEAVRWTPKLVGRLEAWFGRKYPYPKLDLLAVPEFWAGAMENAGAITFREERLLVDPKAVSMDQRSHLITTTAHELAHMWFGDLVTMEWWDDLWLNESFASWMGDKVSQEVLPELDMPVAQVADLQRAMITDAQPSTHAIRHEVDAFGSMDDAFDAITYQKGQAVLGMLEHWLGPDAFRRGVRDYISAHANANATEQDLWAALSKASGRDVTGPARSFIDQAGIPVVKVEPLGDSRIRISQRRLMNAGVAEPGHTLWQIPITLRYSIAGQLRSKAVLLADSVQVVTLESDPDWVWPNADGRGYFRFGVPPKWRQALADSARPALTPAERVAMAGNVPAMIKAGWLHGDEALRRLAQFSDDRDPQVVGTVIEGLNALRLPLVTPSLENAWALYLRRSLGPALDRIGPSPVPGESPRTTLLRPDLMKILGSSGRDPSVLSRAETMTDAYLGDPTALDPSLIEATLELAALRGDSTRFQTYRRRFETATVPADRARFLDAMTWFRDPATMRGLFDYALSGALRPQELGTVFRYVAAQPENDGVLYEWVKRDWARLTKTMPRYVHSSLPLTATGCSRERLADARTFFLDPARKQPGMEHALDKVADAVNDCASLREREGPAVEHWLTELAGVK